MIVTGPISGDPKEKIELWRVASESEFASFGASQGHPKHDEVFTLSGAVDATAPGKGEEAIEPARTRAYALFAELEDFVRDDPTFGNDRVIKSILRTGDCDQGIRDARRWCQIAFDIEVTARI